MTLPSCASIFLRFLRGCCRRLCRRFPLRKKGCPPRTEPAGKTRVSPASPGHPLRLIPKGGSARGGHGRRSTPGAKGRAEPSRARHGAAGAVPLDTVLLLAEGEGRAGGPDRRLPPCTLSLPARGGGGAGGTEG